MLPALTALLAGCSSMSSMNPVNWWHDLEGGKIAEQRPPPPGADDPYPNLANVPAKPTPPNRDTLRKMTEGLVADRQNAQYTAAASPLADPSSPTASPGLFGSGTLPPPPPAPPRAPGSASASLDAATAPPARAMTEPPAPPLPAPIKPVQSAPLTAPEPATAVAAPLPPQPRVVPPQAAEPPPRPPAAPSPVASAAPVPAPSPSSGSATNLAFDPGSAALTPGSAEAVKQVAAHRQAQTVVLTGYGDAASSDPAAQSAALTLAMSRAQAVANALNAAGVPASAIRIGGEAAGRGVSLRLIQ